MDWTEFSKLVVAVIVGAIVPRFFKASDKQQDLVVRNAVASEKLNASQDRIAILERDQKAIWREIDKVKGKI